MARRLAAITLACSFLFLPPVLASGGKLASTVPEPAGLLLFLVGFLALYYFRSKRRDR